jgi:translation initiation factor IF-2
VAINKIDKPEANVQRVKQELADNGILLEEWGGQVLSSKISAKQNIGIDDLLDNILLIAEVEDFRASEKRDALGVVLEAYLDPQKGPVATILVKTGVLKEGQDIIAGETFGRVRRMEDFKGIKILQALPSTPVSLIGLHNSPNSNDIVQVISKKNDSRLKHAGKASFSNSENDGKITAQKILKTIDEEKVKKLNITLKSDVQVSLEAIEQILGEIKSDEVAINYINTGVGQITESDVRFASSSGAAIFGFNIEASSVAKRMADAQTVEIKTYRVIYELVEEIKKRLVALLPKEIERTDFGKLKVLAIFKTGKGDMIVGGKITSGKILNSSLLEVLRNENTIGKGKLQNLQENKINVDECKSGKECGITFLGETKIKEGDVLVSYKEEEKKKTL